MREQIMLRNFAICGALVITFSAVALAQIPRTSATSSSAVSSSRASQNSGLGSQSGVSSAMSSDFQPIERGGFVGRSQEAGFVGRSSSTMGGTSGTGRSSFGTGMGMGMGMNMGMSMGGMGGFGGMGRGMNSQFGSQFGQQNQNAKNTIRATVKVRFPYNRPPVAQVSERVLARWDRMPLPENLKGVDLQFESGVATLTGKVTTLDEKRMAEKLILLEPGVSSVKNQLEVVATAGDSE